jgi:DNA-binding CsgD family transcriptional regulator
MVYLALLSVAVRSRRPSARVPLQPAQHFPSLTEDLTARELQILRLAAAGMTTDEIGESLFLSSNTVKTHLSHAYQKLGAHNRSDAIRVALHCGCLTTEDICPHLPAAPAKDASNG